MRTAEEKNPNSCCLVDSLSLSTVVQTESSGRRPMLWRAALARRQLISLATNGIHELASAQGWKEQAEACGLATNNLSQHYTMYS